MISFLRPYIALLRQQMVSRLQFRFAFFSKIATNIFWGYVRSVIIVVYYTHGAGDSVMSLEQAVSMVWLSQIAMNLLPGLGMDFSVWESIKSGQVGYELLRPIDVYGNWYARAMATKLAPFLMAVVPVSLVAIIIPGGYGLMPPASAAGLLACTATLMTGLVLNCGLIAMSYAMMMDVRVGDKGARFFMTLVQLLSGSMLPLQLWPDWMQGFLYWQPFAGAMDLPLRYYVGAADPATLAQTVMLQLAWAAAAIIIGRAWINANLKKLVIQGG